MYFIISTWSMCDILTSTVVLGCSWSHLRCGVARRNGNINRTVLQYYVPL